MLSLLMLLAAGPEGGRSFLMSAKGLQSLCSKEDDLRTGLCIGYVLAASDQALFQDTTSTPRKLCIPANLSNAMLRDAVMSTFAADSEGLALPAVLYVRKALLARFPCSPVGAPHRP